LVLQDALVRVIDAWVAALDMTTLHFAKAQPQVMGAPSGLFLCEAAKPRGRILCRSPFLPATVSCSREVY
jgi:hypothetical protein